MSKKNKIIYSNVQPNTKEAGVWVNTDDGNVKVEKDGKWVDDGGSGSPTFTYYLLDRYTGENAINMLARYSTYVREQKSGKYFIENTTYFKTRESNFSWEYIYGVCIDWDTPTWIEGELISRRQHFLRNEDASVEEFNQWLTPVTEEEFYNPEP